MNEPEILLPIGSVILLFGLRIRELATRRDIVAGEKKETLTLRLFMLTGLLLIACGIVEHTIRKPAHSVWWILIGWAVAVVSIVLRRRAIAALGRFWSLHVEIRADHQFVRAGPFRWVRHPTYFSMLLELAAVAIFLQAWWSLLVVPLIFFPVLSMRLRLEERALLEKFGDAYREYQRTTPAIIPFKWPT